MSLILLSKQYDELWEESLQTGQLLSYSDEFVTGYEGHIPLIGKVLDWSMPLQDGLEMRLYDYDVKANLHLYEQHGKDSWSGLSFFVAGNVNTTLKGVTDRVDEFAGLTYLSCCSETLEIEDWTAGERIIRLQIHFNPSDLLKNFSLEQLSPLPVEIWQAVEGKIQPYYYPGSMTPVMKTIVHQVLNCPYNGIMKRLYLQGKALELLTLQFEQLQDQHPTVSTKSFLKLDDIDRIHRARDILIANSANPPSLLELARQVAINDHKLKQGFRQVFGTTVFGYLHDYRLEQAQHLLQTSEMSVAEVAGQIGFVDRSHFAAAFRKKFGLNPSQYARQYRNTRSSRSRISPSSPQKNPSNHQKGI